MQLEGIVNPVDSMVQNAGGNQKGTVTGQGDFLASLMSMLQLYNQGSVDVPVIDELLQADNFLLSEQQSNDAEEAGLIIPIITMTPETKSDYGMKMLTEPVLAAVELVHVNPDIQEPEPASSMMQAGAQNTIFADSKSGIFENNLANKVVSNEIKGTQQNMSSLKLGLVNIGLEGENSLASSINEINEQQQPERIISPEEKSVKAIEASLRDNNSIINFENESKAVQNHQKAGIQDQVKAANSEFSLNNIEIDSENLESNLNNQSAGSNGDKNIAFSYVGKTPQIDANSTDGFDVSGVTAKKFPSVAAAQIINAAHYMGKDENKVTIIRLKLEPQNLGEVKIKLSFNNGELSAHFHAASGMVKDAVEGSIPQLRETLAQLNLNLGEATASWGEPQQQGQNNQFKRENANHSFMNNKDFAAARNELNISLRTDSNKAIDLFV